MSDGNAQTTCSLDKKEPPEMHRTARKFLCMTELLLEDDLAGLDAEALE